ncbi:MAG: ATP-binding protein involved in chromosome partitioning [Desulfonauticus sp.]|jgi:Mrp family chromosome partitioning ATPase|nr:ATP-binding protein involved in chromosome partitioning [Desulfonauticus sp.]
MAEEKCSSCAKKDKCLSGQEKEDKIKKVLCRIKHKIVVLSGKGGVGKSTVAVNLAVGLALKGKKVGLLDVDVHGPSVPRLLSLQGTQPHVEKGFMEPVPWGKNLWVMSLGFLLPSQYEAVIWRGPVKIGLIRQFLEDVTWGDLDYLIVDCPPGTGDEPLSVMQLLGNDSYAVIVTTPQGVAIDDVRRSITFCVQLGNPILGIVENMSGFVCPKCGEKVDIFSEGGGEKLAQEMKVPFITKIPLDPEIVRAGEEGYVYIKTKPESEAAKALENLLTRALELDS